MSERFWTCPDCGSPATYCTDSDHGALNGPAVHCTAVPRHNAWSPDEWSAWSADDSSQATTP